MNIYEKLQTCRVDLQNMNLKKTGSNPHLKLKYYELGDFIPEINKLLLKHKLMSKIDFTDVSTLTIIDTEKPESTIEFVSPSAGAVLKNCHDVQNMGASQTYMRRYLYMNAFEIVEHDDLDGTLGQDAPPPKKPTPPTTPPTAKPETPPTGVKLISDAQRKRLFAIAKGDEALLRVICAKCGYESTKDISMADYNTICDLVESNEVKPPFGGGK
jgi:hypothetical protein